MSKVERIASDLGLPATGQDWGIEHADPTRVLAFVTYAESLKPTNEWEMEALAELILESCEESMSQGLMSGEVRKKVVNFIRERGAQFPLTLEHWRSYPESDGWRFLELLREAGYAA